MDREIYKTRIVKALEWLDTNVPEWFNRVDVKKLSMRESTHCVL